MTMKNPIEKYTPFIERLSAAIELLILRVLADDPVEYKNLGEKIDAIMSIIRQHVVEPDAEYSRGYDVGYLQATQGMLERRQSGEIARDDAYAKWYFGDDGVITDDAATESMEKAFHAGWNARQPMREIAWVPDIDVEIAIAEALQLIPRATTYEDKGNPVLHYLKKQGYRIFKSSEIQGEKPEFLHED